jgi:hypothetical protein
VQLTARLFPLGGSREVMKSLLPPEELVFQSGRCPVALEDPNLRRILDAGDSSDGFWVAGEAIFSATELREVSHFELVCRSVVQETESDYKANAIVCERIALVDAGGHAPIRLVTGFTLSRIRLKPNVVGSIGDWTGEFVIPSGVAKVFEAAGLRGFSLEPIANPKTGLAHEGYFQIYSKSVVAAATIDCSVERIQSCFPEENGHLRHLGCLSYPAAALAHRPDFNRTAEPWGGWHGWPSWVVSSRVVSAFKGSKCRGWHFRPVLITDTELYSQYIGQWEQLCDAVARTRKSQFDGGRW